MANGGTLLINDWPPDVVYYQDQPPPDDKPSGCLDVLLIMRAVFGVLFWPVAAIIVVFVDLGVTWVLFTKQPALALVTIVPTAVAIWLFARWEQRRFRPPDV